MMISVVLISDNHHHVVCRRISMEIEDRSSKVDVQEENGRISFVGVSLGCVPVVGNVL
jgi:hypothetical protein